MSLSSNSLFRKEEKGWVHRKGVHDGNGTLFKDASGGVTCKRSIAVKKYL